MKKAAYIALALLAVIAFGDVLLGWLVEAVELLLEVLELLMDHVLETFLAPHEAQLVTAWLGFCSLALLLTLGLRWAYNKYAAWKEQLAVAAPSWWEEEKVRLGAMRSRMGWPLLTVVLLVLLVLIYL